MASETPRQVYERVTGKPWPKPGSPEAQEMLDSLGIKAKSGSAAANIALAKALTAPASSASTEPVPAPRGNAIEAGYQRMVGDEAPASLNKGFLGLLGRGRPKAFSKEFVGPQQDERIGPQQEELGLLGHLQNALAATRQGIGAAAESGGKRLGVPLHTRLALGSAIGNRAPITNADLTPEELAEVQRTFANGTISDYNQYPQGLNLQSNPLARMADRSQAIPQAFGRASIDSPRPGQRRLSDIYNFVNDAREQAQLRYDQATNSVERAAALVELLAATAAEKGPRAAMNQIPDQVMNMAMGREGRDVDIRFPADINLPGPSRKPAKRGPTTLQRAIRKTNN